jgi:predicted RNA-binding protein with PUA-like domain
MRGTYKAGFIGATDISSKERRTTFAPGRAAAYSTPMARNYWLVKQEPEAYSWSSFAKDKGTAWTGVRNFQARNNLRQMKKGDLVFYYHSVSDKQVVGVAKVAKEAYPDPTAEGEDWSSVDLTPLKPLAQPVSLDAIKADETLKDMAIVRQSRLSVMPLSEKEATALLALGKTRI